MSFCQRVLCFIISWMLAAPPFVAHAASPARASKPVRNSLRSQATRLVPPVANGRAIYVRQTPGARGRLKSRIVSTLGFSEVLLDEDDDGRADLWEITQGDVKLTSSLMVNGRFTKIMAEKRLRKGLLEAEFVLNPDHRSYRMIYAQLRPYSKMGETAAPLIIAPPATLPAPAPTPICPDPDRTDPVAALRQSLQDIMRLGSNTAVENALQCKIRRLQNFLFDRGCSTPPFSGDLGNMVQGLASVMASPASSEQPGGSSRYLSCLSDNGLRDSSLKVQEDWARNFENVIGVMRANQMSDGEINRLLQDSSCEPIDGRIRSAARGTDYSPQELLAGANRVAPYACRASSTNVGDYDQRTQQVTVFASGSVIANRYGGLPHQGYASLFMHEHLHGVGFGESDADHDMIHAAQECCAPQGAGASSCVTLRTLVRNRAAADEDEARFGEALPGYADAKVEILNAFGVENGKMMMQRYFNSVRNATAADRAESAAAYRRCATESNPAACRETVANRFLTNQISASNRFFDRECPAYAAVPIQNRRASAGVCGQMRERFAGMMNPTTVLQAQNAAPSTRASGPSPVSTNAPAVMEKLTSTSPRSSIASVPAMTIDSSGEPATTPVARNSRAPVSGAVSAHEAAHTASANDPIALLLESSDRAQPQVVANGRQGELAAPSQNAARNQVQTHVQSHEQSHEQSHAQASAVPVATRPGVVATRPAVAANVASAVSTKPSNEGSSAYPGAMSSSEPSPGVSATSASNAGYASETYSKSPGYSAFEQSYQMPTSSSARPGDREGRAEGDVLAGNAAAPILHSATRAAAPVVNAATQALNSAVRALSPNEAQATEPRVAATRSNGSPRQVNVTNTRPTAAVVPSSTTASTERATNAFAPAAATAAATVDEAPRQPASGPGEPSVVPAAGTTSPSGANTRNSVAPTTSGSRRSNASSRIRTSFRSSTELERYIMSSDFERVPEMTSNPEFRAAIERNRIAIRLPSGAIIGSRAPNAIIMVPCPQRQRYVLAGACR